MKRLENMLETLKAILTDVKVYISITLLPLFQGFYGPSWELMGIIFFSAFIDIYMGYLKNKKTKGESFKVGRLLEKLKQIGAVFVVLSLANYNDPMFMHIGFNKFTMGINVCVVFGIWQFLHTLENTSSWLPQEVKDALKEKIKEKLSIKKEEVQDDKNIQE